MQKSNTRAIPLKTSTGFPTRAGSSPGVPICLTGEAILVHDVCVPTRRALRTASMGHADTQGG